MGAKLTIVGIDPGTTVGYAVLDINGKPILFNSSKHLSMSNLISEIITFGKVLVVGTDKAKVPSAIEFFSTKTGCRVIRPDEDLKVKMKKILINNYKVKNAHEGDALASAIFAYKEIESLLSKIKKYVIKHKKEKNFEKIVELVVLQGISIKHAVDIIEKPHVEESRIIKKVVEEKELRKDDFLKLYNKVKRYKREALFLRTQNKKIDNQNKELMIRLKSELKRTQRLFNKKNDNIIIDQKEQRIKLYDHEIKDKNKEHKELINKVNEYNYLLANLNNNYLLKKLKNLGKAEFEKKDFLNIGKNDILYVDDVNIHNLKKIDEIKDKVKIIIFKKKPNRTTRNLPFIFIDVKELKIKETEHFVIINKSHFNEVLNKNKVFEKVVKDYQKERVINPYSQG